MADLQQARAAKARLRAALLGHAGVQGVGLTRLPQGYGLQVNLADGIHRDGVPATFDGVPVRIRVVGAIHAHR
jgi:hypothetical protein